MAFVSDRGKFLLKRRPKGKDDLYRVAFAHAVQNHLSQEGFPVPSLVATCDETNTVLHLDNHIYELFRFISGSRYDGSPQATIDTGLQLARFHELLADFAQDWDPLKATFHDSSSVRRYLRAIGSSGKSKSEARKDSHPWLPDAERKTAEALMALYNDSSIQVNKLGFPSWDQQVVHGDWHPGNMLFSQSRIVAVLDFDSIKVAPPITDLANAMLQFSIVGGRPNPADWPDYFDQDKLLQILTGYCRRHQLDEARLTCLVDLMIETMIAEAVLPIAATGFFGHLHGHDFLKMILRKAKWLDAHRKKLTDAITTQPSKPSPTN
jgi:Ser/Thr protein kinase RdoA (MazF antagonist)